MAVPMRNPEAGAHPADLCAVMACGLTLLVLGACDKARPGPVAPSAAHALLGERAPEFELPAQTGGEPLALAPHVGKVVIVDFWATWCDPCRDSFPFYQSLSDKYGDRLVVLGISVDEHPGGIANFVAETGVKFPVGWDEGQVVAGRYEPDTMPTSYIIDKHGVIAHVHAGFREGDEESLVHHLNQLLQKP
jgi:cytochrome c biogenesis protein CcmG, thiol:disulfide interchange protein DsbE